MRRVPLTSLTPPALREPSGSASKPRGSTNEVPDLQLVAQRRFELELHLTPADVIVRRLRPIKCARRDGLVFGAHIYSRGRFEELKKTLHDHALEELDVTRLVVGEVGDLATSQSEEVLQVLLPAV